MALPAFQPQGNAAAAFGRTVNGTGVSGGPVADLHYAIEQRLAGERWRSAVPPLGDGGEYSFVSRLSRGAGIISLALTYAGVAIWWF